MTKSLKPLGMLLVLGLMLLARPAVAEEESAALPEGMMETLAQIEQILVATQEDQLAAYAAVDEATVVRWCRLLCEAGHGDDANVRQALHGLVFAAGDADLAGLRSQVTAGLLAALAERDELEVEAFLLDQLRLVGGVELVAPLLPYLGDAELAEPAVRTLLSVAGQSDRARGTVSAAFEEALPNAAPEARLTLVRALGVVGTRTAVTALLEITRDDEYAQEETKDVRRAALFALASTGHSDALPKLLEATVLGTPYEQAQGRDLLLRFLPRYAERGHQYEAVRLLRGILASPPTDGQTIALQSAALTTLVEMVGTGALDELQQALANSSAPALQATAAALAVGLPGRDVTHALAGELLSTGPEVQVVLLQVLGQRRDAAAASYVRQVLPSETAMVRRAALHAIAAILGPEALPDLLTALDTDDREQQEAAVHALRRMRSPELGTALAQRLARQPARVRSQMLEVMAGLPGRDAREAVWGATVDPESEVRAAALQALALLAEPADAGKLLELLIAARTGAERRAATEAVVAACEREPDVDARALPVVRAWLAEPDADAQRALLTVLGKLGGAAALEIVQGALHSDNVAVAEAALRALADWPDGLAAETLLRHARDVADERQHVLALRGYVQLIQRQADEQPAGRTLEALREALGVARRSEERRLIIGAVGSVNDPGALELLEAQLADVPVAGEAEAALVSVADKIMARDWRSARTALDRVLADTNSDTTQARATAARDRLATYEDYITDWQWAGPYTAAGKQGSELYDVAFPPEAQLGAKSAEERIDWQPWVVRDGPDAGWRLDLHEPWPGDHQAVYLLTYVYSPTTQPAQLQVGSDDGIKVWFNGRVVIDQNVLRGCALNQDQANVSLAEGWNALMLKVTNNGGAWSCCARVRDPDGGHVADLRVSAAGPNKPE